MSFLQSDLTYWGLAAVIAIVGLIRLATRRREQLTEVLSSYVKQKQATSSESSDPPA